MGLVFDNLRDLDLSETLDCGQCFRFNEAAGGIEGVAFGRFIRIEESAGEVRLIGVGESEYREIFDLVSRHDDVEVITGVDLKKSIFSGSPGAFVGVGNCLVSTREEGKADVTYVGSDVTLSAPAPILYPTEPDLADTIVFLNSIDKRN